MEKSEKLAGLKSSVNREQLRNIVQHYREGNSLTRNNRASDNLLGGEEFSLQEEVGECHFPEARPLAQCGGCGPVQ